MLRFGLSLSLLLAGCGLTLDYDPPDPQPGYDGGGMDAGRSDAGGQSDSGTSDAGPPVDCVEDVDCDDEDACTGVEQCVDGLCVPGEPIACPDENVCDGVDVCVDGECIAGAPMACPLDSNPCNGEEFCDAVIGCTARPPESCDDGVECTVDTCDPSDGCLHTPNEALCPAGPGRRCDTELGCQYDVCDSTTCVPTGCTDAHCADERTCIYTPLCDFASFCCAGMCELPGCDDGNPCTADACDPVTGCRHDPVVGASCDDRNRCTVGESCGSDGTCGGGARRDCSDGNPCTSDSCEPAVGCTTTPVPDGTTLCSDGNACTIGDRCESGACAPGMTRLCMLATDDAACLTARCDPTVGCVVEPIAAGRTCLSGSGVCDGAGHCCGSNSDCDGDGICECPAGTTCGFAGGCPGSDCGADADCPVGQSCCGGTSTGGTRRGYCYSNTCPSCCAVAVAP